jgi:lipopolysaccharide export system permease protein
MVIAGRVQRYVFRESLSALLLTLGIIILAILLVDVVEQMRTVGARTDVSILTAFRLTLMKTPGLLMETLPFATLVGAILTYSQLSRRSEIPAIRAAGVSAWRFLGPTIFLAALTGALMMTVIDPLGARLTRSYDNERARLLGQGEGVGGRGVWLSQGDAGEAEPGDPAATARRPGESRAIIKAARVVGRGEALEDVTFYYFSAPPGGGVADQVFNRRIDATRAVLVPGFWQLEGAVENEIGGAVVRHDKLAVPTTLEANTLLARFAQSKTISFWDLPGLIREGRAAGMDINAYVLKFHTLLATPALMVAMSLIGAIVCLRLSRSGGLTRLVATGALAGFLLYFVNRVVYGLSASGAVAPEAAAWCPPLFALFSVLTLIAHIEDG